MLKNNFTAAYLTLDGTDSAIIHLSNFDTKEQLLSKAADLTPDGKELVELLYQSPGRGTCILWAKWDKSPNKWREDIAEEAFWAKK